jgi:hypothetical protein
MFPVTIFRSERHRECRVVQEMTLEAGLAKLETNSPEATREEDQMGITRRQVIRVAVALLLQLALQMLLLQTPPGFRPLFQPTLTFQQAIQHANMRSLERTHCQTRSRALTG